MSAAETNKWFLLDDSSGGHLISESTCIYRYTPCIFEEIWLLLFHFSHVHVGTYPALFHTGIVISAPIKFKAEIQILK